MNDIIIKDIDLPFSIIFKLVFKITFAIFLSSFIFGSIGTVLFFFTFRI